MSFSDFLSWLTGADGGAFILVSWAISWALEGSERWQALGSQVKTAVIVGISALLGAGAVALQANPDLVAAIAPYFQPLIYIVLTWLGTQTAHKLNVGRRIEGEVLEVDFGELKESTEEAQAGPPV